jgi:hypothetical protein
MAVETILQNWILTDFVYPFLLVFFIVFAVLEKSKVLGEGRAQLNALVAFVIGLIFVGAVFPKTVLNNMVLFLTVSLIVVFVLLLLWGFAIGGDVKIENKIVQALAGVLIFIVVAVAVLWATGALDPIYQFLFKQVWSKEFWTNAIFIIVIVIALALVVAPSVIKGKGK